MLEQKVSSHPLNTCGNQSSHLLAQGRDISRGLADAVATVMMGIELVSQLLKHGRVCISRDRLRRRLGSLMLLEVSLTISLGGGHGVVVVGGVD